MRNLIAGMKISVDGKMEGPEATADWVDAWSEDYGLTPQIDACVIGAAMYPGYERYWTSIQNEPDIKRKSRRRGMTFSSRSRIVRPSGNTTTLESPEAKR